MLDLSRTNVHFVILGVSKVFDRMNFNKLIAQLKEIQLTMKVVNLQDFMLKKSLGSLN